MLQKRDMLWILAYPIYQIIGTIRHEGSHALVALLEGARVTDGHPSRNMVFIGVMFELPARPTGYSLLLPTWLI
jgi:hypothetical protein